MLLVRKTTNKDVTNISRCPVKDTTYLRLHIVHHGTKEQRKRKLDTTSSNSKKVINDKDTVRLEPVKKARTKKTRGAVGEEEDSFSEYEQQEDFVDMADISGFSRFSIDSADSTQDGNELETRWGDRHGGTQLFQGKGRPHE